MAKECDEKNTRRVRIIRRKGRWIKTKKEREVCGAERETVMQIMSRKRKRKKEEEEEGDEKK